ncbi:hypothetical protein G9A89_022151 [Geosiphon pyriformis]|nr:hypothetical protein G9A89_022151 [Geosiphon pyriformis]
MDLLFALRPQIIIYIILQRTGTNHNYPKYSQQLGLNNNHFPVESVFNFYINDKITDCLGGTVNIESARENFYTELFQHTSLPKNYNKGKGKLQTPAVTPKQIQPLIWKKTRVESPTNPSYHYTSRSAINISSIALNFQTQQNQNNQNLKAINQQNIPPPLPQPQIQLPFPLPQQPNIDPIAYAPIAKLEKFTGEENNAQTFQKFKVAFLGYFSNNNSINCLANTFTTIKQEETEAVTTYLEHFHRNLCQIQAIQADNFTAPQILNQFIHELCNSILQHVHSIHPADLQAIITNAKDFEAAELKANHTQAVNLVMNESSKLDSNHVHYPQPINSGSRRHVFVTTMHHINQLINDTTINIPTTYISASSLLTAATSNISTITATNNLSDTCNLNTAIKFSLDNIRKLQIKSYPKLEISNSCLPINSQFIQPVVRIITVEFKNWNYLSLLVTPKDTQPNKLKTHSQPTLTSNIPPATITENKLLDAIFLFELEELSAMSLFSGAVLKEKPITIMYTDAKVDGYPIKLILDSGSAGSIITRQLMDQLTDGVTKTLISKIDNLFIEINDIIVFIKVLVMEAIQYQALNGLNAQKDKENEITNLVSYMELFYLMKECGMTFLDKEERTPINNIWKRVLRWLERYFHDKHEIWRIVSTKAEDTTIKEDEPISSCASESKPTSNPDSNSDNNNDDENNDSSSAQYDNKNNSNSNFNSNSKQYIALLNFFKEQELKWFSNNNESIMPECAHNINAEFNLRYPGKDLIKLESYSHTCIDLKIALEILVTTMVQLASRSSLAKKGINIRRGIIDTEYVENIIVILQNDLEKAYIIDSNKKIAQAIFLSLVKVAQLVSVGNREKLGITARGI